MTKTITTEKYMLRNTGYRVYIGPFYGRKYIIMPTLCENERMLHVGDDTWGCICQTVEDVIGLLTDIFVDLTDYISEDDLFVELSKVLYK